MDPPAETWLRDRELSMERTMEGDGISGFEAWEEEVQKYSGRQTGPLYKAVSEDPRFLEAVKGCLECGNCLANCPAAAEKDYDPKEIIMVLFQGYDQKILELMREKMYHCVQCKSCAERCPRENRSFTGITILRELARARGLYREP
jgi:heterodisulfide reductase subunit C